MAQQHTSGSATAAAAPGCAQANVNVPVLVSRTSSGCQFTLTGQTSKASGRGPLAITCKAQGNGIQIKIKSRFKRRHLRAIVGPHLRLGFSNPTSHALTIKTTDRIGP